MHVSLVFAGDDILMTIGQNICVERQGKLIISLPALCDLDIYGSLDESFSDYYTGVAREYSLPSFFMVFYKKVLSRGVAARKEINVWQRSVQKPLFV